MKKAIVLLAFVGLCGPAFAQTNIGQVDINPAVNTVTCAQSTAANLKVDLSGTGANSTAVKVDGSAATQPVSGTVTCNAGTGTLAVSGPLTDTQLRAAPVPVTDGSGALNVIVDSSALPSGASTAAKQPGLGTAGSASTDVITVQGIGSMTPIIVSDGSGALNAIVDSGTITAVTTVTNPVTVTDGSGALTVDGAVTANAGTNLNTSALALESGGNLAGAATSLAVIDDWDESDRAKVNPIVGQAGVQGASGTVSPSTQRVVLATDVALPAGTNNIGDVDVVSQDTSAATGAAPPSRANYVGGIVSGATAGLLGGLTVCDQSVAVNISTATTTLVITGVSGRNWYICSLSLVTAAANNVALVTGTGGTCGTSTAGVNGGTTAASGWNFAANGGLTQGSGLGVIMSSLVSGGATGDSLCIITSAGTQLSGNISFAIY